jgi:hypothetical protein
VLQQYSVYAADAHAICFVYAHFFYYTLLCTEQQAAQEQERVTLTARTKHCMENFHRNNVFKRVAMEIIAYTLEPEEMQVCYSYMLW